MCLIFQNKRNIFNFQFLPSILSFRVKCIFSHFQSCLGLSLNGMSVQESHLVLTDSIYHLVWQKLNCIYKNEKPFAKWDKRIPKYYRIYLVSANIPFILLLRDE